MIIFNTKTVNEAKKKKKKNIDFSCITTGDIDYNIKQFNKRMGTDFDAVCGKSGAQSVVDTEVSQNSTNTYQDIGDNNMNENTAINEETKRLVKRYYIRPQNVFCSTKYDILKTLADSKDTNCSVYSLKSLADHDDVHLLTKKDIIYYYDNNALYDKNHMQILDYDLYVKHEEDRKKINIDSTPEKELEKVYSDRITELDDKTSDEIKVKESLEESISQNIAQTYALISDQYNINLNDLIYGKNGFMANNYPDGFEDFSGDIIYSKKYWDEFEEWLKSERGIDLEAKKKELEKEADGDIISEDDFFNQDFESFNAYGEKITNKLKESKKEVCCICGEPIEGYGNNPRPYKNEGRCCDACNIKFVIPARFAELKSEKDD